MEMKFDFSIDFSIDFPEPLVSLKIVEISSRAETMGFLSLVSSLGAKSEQV